MAVTHDNRDMEITFGPKDERPLIRPHNDALVCTVELAGCVIHRVFVDTGSSVNILYQECLQAMNIGAQLESVPEPLYGFTGKMVIPTGRIELPLTLGSPSARKTNLVEFLVIDQKRPAYNIILGRPALDAFRAVVSMYYLKMKFPVEGGIREIYGNQVAAKECYVRTVTRQEEESETGQGETSMKKKKFKTGSASGVRQELAEDEDQGYNPDQPLIMPRGHCMSIELILGRMGLATKVGTTCPRGSSERRSIHAH